MIKTCLTIAGSDCSGGAGIQADLKTFSTLGTYGMSVIASVVAENTRYVISIQDIDPQILRDQIDAVMEDIPPDAVKCGMLSGVQAMETVAERLRWYRPAHVVVDPVMVAKGGCALMQPDALSTLIREILPLAQVLTPNIPEAAALTGISITSMEDMERAAETLYSMGSRYILLKGGHLVGDQATDLLYDGNTYQIFSQERIHTKNTHGTGCTLSSAITAELAKGFPVPEAIRRAKDYVTMAIRHALPLGKGHGPTHHFYAFYHEEGDKPEG